ncbi:unnamed protein product, partial [Tuber aestivum]
MRALKAMIVGEKEVDRNLTIERDTLLYKNLIIERDRLLYKNRWCIPDSLDLKEKIMETKHDSHIAKPSGTYKTVGRVRSNFVWPKMDEAISDYILTCDTSQPNKSIKHKKFALLEPVGVLLRLWTDISIDFIVALPESEGYIKIAVIVD